MILNVLGITGVDHNSMVESFMRRDPRVVKGYSLNLLEFNDFMLFYNGVKEAFTAFTGIGYIKLYAISVIKPSRKMQDTADNTRRELDDFLKNFEYKFEKHALTTFLEIFDDDKRS